MRMGRGPIELGPLLANHLSPVGGAVEFLVDICCGNPHFKYRFRALLRYPISNVILVEISEMTCSCKARTQVQ